MIHRVEEGAVLHYGLNVETVRNQGMAFILFWRGWTHYYGARLRLFWSWRRPRVSGWRADIGATCSHCGYWNHHDVNVRDVQDGRIYCNNCGEMFECSDR